MMRKLLYCVWPVSALLFACTDDNSVIEPKPATLQTTLAAGTWEVSSYIDSHPAPPLVEEAENPPADKEDLNDLPNYTFSFKPKDMIIATAYGTTDPVGLWTASVNDSGEEILNMHYPYKPLDGLTGEWTVTERTENQVHMKHRDPVYGGDDLLVLRKTTGEPAGNS